MNVYEQESTAKAYGLILHVFMLFLFLMLKQLKNSLQYELSLEGRNSCMNLRVKFSSNPLSKTVPLKCDYDKKIGVCGFLVFFFPTPCVF